MTRLLLIRHGQTTSNLSRSLDTDLPGASLTDLGWHQAYAAGERIAVDAGAAGTADPGTPASGLFLVSSQALRARQTAAGIVTGAASRGVTLGATAPGTPFAASLPGLQVTGGLERSEVQGPVSPEDYLGYAVPAALGGTVPDPAAVTPVVPVRQLDAARTAVLPAVMPGAVPGLSEIPAGTYEMRSDPEAHLLYHRTFADWLGGALDLSVPGALTGREVVGRYLAALLPMLATARSAGSDLAVVSHGAVIRLIAGYLGRVDPEYAVRTLLPNTSRVELEVPESVAVPELPTVDAPTVPTAAYLPELTDLPDRPDARGLQDLRDTRALPATSALLSDSLTEGWKVTDWAGHGEPPGRH